MTHRPKSLLTPTEQQAGMTRIVLASNNAGKLREFSALLATAGIELIAQSEFGIPEAAEPHATFIENALAKARHAAKLTGLPALADDSGLCVHALSGAPGIHSARYAAGQKKSDDANNARLIEQLQGQPDRRAYYYCVIAMLRHAEDSEPIITEGRWHGEILDAPRGVNGFGYDPYFFIPTLNASAAELPTTVKNLHSHRALALQTLLIRLTQQT